MFSAGKTDFLEELGKSAFFAFQFLGEQIFSQQYLADKCREKKIGRKKETEIKLIVNRQ